MFASWPTTSQSLFTLKMRAMHKLFRSEMQMHRSCLCSPPAGTTNALHGSYLKEAGEVLGAAVAGPNPQATSAQMLLESVRLLEQTSPSTGGATYAEYRQLRASGLSSDGMPCYLGISRP